MAHGVYKAPVNQRRFVAANIWLAVDVCCVETAWFLYRESQKWSTGGRK